jgi:hypothetical protein
VGEVRPISRHSTLRRHFILVGGHRTAGPLPNATAKTTAASANQAHFAPDGILARYSHRSATPELPLDNGARNLGGNTFTVDDLHELSVFACNSNIWHLGLQQLMSCKRIE